MACPGQEFAAVRLDVATWEGEAAERILWAGRNLANKKARRFRRARCDGINLVLLAGCAEALDALAGLFQQFFGGRVGDAEVGAEAEG